jgi:hypothetical protein
VKFMVNGAERNVLEELKVMIHGSGIRRTL